MLQLDDIMGFYPESLHDHKGMLLREYLQYKILEVIYASEFGEKLIFMGGACLRIVHGNQRFSEGIDFDNKGISTDEFTRLSELVGKELELEGYQVEIKLVYKNAFHCHIRFPGLPFQEGLSGHRAQKILIQLDTEPQHYNYEPQPYLLNKFDVFTEVLATPPSILLAQKMYAVINRKRNKGRDFYDIAFLLSKGIQPDMGYIKSKLAVEAMEELKTTILDKCRQLDMKEMALDVQPFLFRPTDTKKVEHFSQLIAQSL